MRRQVAELGEAAPLLDTIASNEPTPRGHYDLTAGGLAWRAQPDDPEGPAEDQVGMPPIATVLARWLGVFGGHVSGGMGASFYAGRVANRLPMACQSSTHIAAFAGELRSLLGAARRAMHRELRAERYAAPCPQCSALELRREIGEDEIFCRACGCVWEEGEYVALALLGAPDDAKLYAHEVATLLGQKPATVDRWRARGYLVACGDRDGRPVYTAGNARDAYFLARLRRDRLAELRVIPPGLHADDYDSHIVPAGSVATVAGLFELELRRGHVVTIGPVDPAEVTFAAPPEKKPVAPKEVSA